MGQTLSHGVYLPNEGERNCYAGLASNWQILNTAVGAIAEKAPLVHTHTVSQITDFPAYGNAAGTICEGNDSRLSDARTPVAHTHGKADITDLLNSNFIPSANNSYDLGSSSYQWNNAYIKSLTINGVACGDILTHNASEFVDVSTAQTIGGVKTFSNDIRINKASPRLQMKSTTYSSETSSAMTIGDIALLNNDGGFSAWMVHQLRDDLTKRLCFRVYPHADSTYRGLAFDDSCNLYPENSNSALGTSTNKWKSLNGINPGALSLPSSDSADYIDLSSNLSTNAEYQYTAPYDGWLCLYVIVNEFYTENAVGLYRSDTSANSHQWAKSVTAAINLYKQNKYQGSVMLPVESGKKYICYISLNANATIHNKLLFFYKNKGNV